MWEAGIIHMVLAEILGHSLPLLIKKQKKSGKSLFFFSICTLMMSLFMLGCSSSGLQAAPTFEEANDLFSQGNYQASLDRYEKLIGDHPEARDRVLFEMGIIHSHPKNEKKDYRKSLECFQKLIRDYPGSDYRRDSEVMIFSIHNTANKERTIAAQQARIESLRQEVKRRENEIAALHQNTLALQQKILALQQMTLDLAVKKKSIDKILIEKQERRLTLLSRDAALKTYRIALGGNPNGPKEREGDGKTPEGSYVIDSKNGNSSYHLSLHISYPNKRDRMRAKKLGSSPGGNIMIHGIKNGFSWVGDSHTDIDWTRGCIAVTDEEIEELYRLVPVGTAVEIRP